MEKRTRRKLKADDLEKYMGEPGDYPDMTTTVSATETTGLFPAPPLDDAEYQSYQNLAGMQIPKMDKPDN